ncbi:MAG: DUF6328 family protein [Chloroflexota bacterium]|nr:DUF6328 family protein [Chloroflexota bacterium]
MAEHETQKERIDRELIELLNELRVALPGVQVLFAFLLVLPFQQGWAEATELQKAVYFMALVASAIAGALLIAPSVYHRLNFRRKVKEQMLFDSNRMLIAATVFMAGGIAGSLFVIADVLYGSLVGLLTLGVSLLLFLVVWYLFPLQRRGEPDDELETQEG